MPPKIEFLINITQLLNASIVCFYWRAHDWGKYCDEWYDDNKTRNFITYYVVYITALFVGLYFDRLYFAIIHVLITKIHD